MKTKLSLLPLNRGAFNCKPANEVEIESERVLCNDITFPWESHPHGMRLWVIGNEFGALCAVWAGCDQDALDGACDAGLLDSLAISAEDFAAMSEAEQEDCITLGNASEPFDQTYLWMQCALLDPAKDIKLIVLLSTARALCVDNLKSNKL